MYKPISTLLLSFLLLFAHLGNAIASEKQDPRILRAVSDFARLGAELEQQRVPLVLMFSSEYCAYCARVESDFLIPMQISGDYEGRAVIRKLKIDYGNSVRDFDGSLIDSDEFAARYNINVTPTVVFLGARGEQLAPKRVGLMTPDFYGGYLDESIATALDMLRRTTPLRVKLSSNP